MKVRHILLAAVLALPIAACSPEAGDQAESTTAPTSASSDLMLTGSPSTEPGGPGAPSPEAGGPQQPGNTGKNIPSLYLPELPVGGGTEDEGTESLCQGASWGGPDIPEGISVSVTAALVPAGVFEIGKSGSCRPDCTSGFTFTADKRNCSIFLTAKAHQGKTARVILKGTIGCPSGQQQKCQSFRQSVLSNSNVKLSPVTQPTTPKSGSSTTTTTS
jgi:hypothetical protein